MTNWITFIGHGRSGHTIVSAILDSHPNVRISEEQKYIGRWHQENWKRKRIINHLLPSGQGKERKQKALPGSGAWKGGHELLYMGDKWGLDAVNQVRKMGAGLSVLDDFGAHMGMEVKVIHTVRNPYDNICCWLDSPKYQRWWPDEDWRYRMSIRRYARFYSTADQLLQRYPHFNLHNEELISDPRDTLTKMCEYLELPVEEPWLTNAANSVFGKPNERSKNRVWIPEWEAQMKWRVIDRWPQYFEQYKESECYKRWI